MFEDLLLAGVGLGLGITQHAELRLNLLQQPVVLLSAGIKFLGHIVFAAHFADVARIGGNIGAEGQQVSYPFVELS